MKSNLTGSLVVCVAAAVFAVGALLLNEDSPASTRVAATVGESGADATGGGGSGPSVGGYRAPSSAGGATAGAAAASTLEIRDFAFSAVTASPGGRVSIQSRDSVPHTVTADSGAFDSGRVAPKATATIVAPRTPGSYRFTCLIHPQMSGTLVVR